MIDLQAPAFWYRRAGVLSVLLRPLSWVWRGAGAARAAMARPYTSTIPVLCIGNVCVGGAGKTPVAIALARRLAARRPCFMTRGYGGITGTPALLRDGHDPRHGDEAALLARHAPVIVSPDRKEGLRMAEAAGFGMVIADDGFQNPHFTKTASVLVFDGATGIGNGVCVPAGPCRERLEDAVPRAEAAVIVGEDATDLTAKLDPLPVFHARMVPLAAQPGRVVAFAGIGRPEKFFETLKLAGYEVAEAQPFPDHHVFTMDELDRLHGLALRHGARLITTEKDHVRLPAGAQASIDTLPVTLEIDDIDGLAARLGFPA